jgi:hypothetical protein
MQRVRLGFLQSEEQEVFWFGLANECFTSASLSPRKERTSSGFVNYFGVVESVALTAVALGTRTKRCDREIVTLG